MVAFFRLAAAIAVVLPAVLAEPLSSPAGLYARQVSGLNPSSLPASCLQNQCQNFVDTITTKNCVSLDCLCTDAVASSMKSCIQCAVDAKIEGFNQTVADSTMSDFSNGCKTAGHPISASVSSTGKTGGALSMTVNILGMVAAAALGGVALA